MDDVAVVGVIFGTLVPVVLFIGLFTFLAIAARSSSRQKIAESQGRYEFLKKMSESASFDTQKFIEFEKAELATKRARRISNLRLWGFIFLGLGGALALFLFAVGVAADESPLMLGAIGLIPLALGGALMLASKLEARELTETAKA
ncbi:MAG: hypothetical protein V3U86_07465 [Acidobacteriota bacterium]